MRHTKLEDIKKLESDLYDESITGVESKPISRRSGGAIKSYVTKPSTHGGFYFSGIGCVVGGLGGFLWSIGNSLYSDGPEILTKIYAGTWQEAGYQTLYLIAKSALNAAYVAGASGTIGYIGGSILTGRIWDSLASFFNSIFGPKQNRR